MTGNKDQSKESIDLNGKLEEDVVDGSEMTTKETEMTMTKESEMTLTKETEMTTNAGMTTKESDSPTNNEIEMGAPVIPARLFKVKLGNLPKYVTAGQLRKFLCSKLALTEQELQCRKNMQWNHAIVAFQTEEQQKHAIVTIPAFPLRKHTLTAQIYTALEESETSERRGHQDKRKRTTEGQEKEKTMKLEDQVTPLHNVPYEEQLRRKRLQQEKSIKALRKELKQCGIVHAPVRLPETKPSPLRDHYRTKCLFTVAWNRDGAPSVGFLLGLYKDGLRAVESPENCVHVPAVSKHIAAMFEQYLRGPVDKNGDQGAIDLSTFPPYNREDKSGIWRVLTVKAQESGEVMITVGCHPQDLTAKSMQDTNMSQLEYIKESLVKMFSGYEFRDTSRGIDYRVTTLIMETSTDFSNSMVNATSDVLFGPGYVHEQLFGLRFRISPSAFFQVNTLATQVLYREVAKFVFRGQNIPSLEETEKLEDAAMSISSEDAPAVSSIQKTTILDLCCGTGTIGLTIAAMVEDHVDRVIGIEMCPEAVVDANVNATLNNKQNLVQYHTGKVEDHIDSAISSLEATGTGTERIVAILDPPRCGLPQSVMISIRKCVAIRRVVFVSCRASSAVQNFSGLCRRTSKRFGGEPFTLTQAQPVDLFPHTEHCELVLSFDR